jgi:autotransporter-associated beta strand protein
MGVVLSNTTDNIVNIDSTGGVTISSIISGTGNNLTRGGAGSGILTLGGANTFTGTFTANTGTTNLSVNNALGGATAVSVASGAKVQTSILSLTNAINDNASVTLNGTIDLTGGAETVASLAGTNTAASLVIGKSGTTAGTFTVGNARSTSFAGVISGAPLAAGNTIFTKQGAGALTLPGVNTYSGSTTISAGTLALSGSGSIANSPIILLAGGATFDVSALTTPLTLASGQALSASGTTTTGTIATTTGKGLTLASNSPLQFTAFNGSTAPLTISGAGTITLASTNPVTVTVTGGTPLAAGDYTLISKGTGGGVDGIAPTSLTVNGNGVASGTTPSLQITGNQLILHVAPPTTPTIAVSTSSLSSFGIIAVGSTSSEQSYTVSGSNLTSDITINAPTDFEISTTTGTSFGSTVTLTQTGGSVATTNIFVHFKPGTTGAKSGNITHDSTGATQATVAVSGTGISAEPTVQASNLIFSSVGANSMTLTWTNGNGANRIVLAKATSAVDSNPVDGTSYTANAAFGSGTQIGTGNFVIFSGSGNSVTVTGLAGNTTYNFAVYEFNGSSGSENYLTASPATGSQATPVATYTWIATSGSGAWTTSTNWSPTRTVPATSDILQFSNGGSVTVISVPAQTIGQLFVSGNTTVDLQAGGTNTLTIGGGTDIDLSVASGSSLNTDGASILTISLSTGATGSISGSMTFDVAAHRLLATDANSITFQTGSTFTAASTFGGNAFGTTSLGSVIFASGSTYVHNGGSNPFGASAPNSVVTFQSGSLYKVTANVTPSLSGRTYANIEINSAAFSQSQTGGSALTTDSITVTAGVWNINVTGGANVKGNLSVASGATLGFSPASANVLSLNGSATQIISGAGTLTFGSNTNLTINNSAGVTLNRNITVSGTLTLAGGTFTIGSANTVTIGTGGTIAQSGTGAITSGANGGTVTFVGTGTVSGTVGFYNVNINGAVNFGTGSTINNSLTIFQFASVNTNPPIYATGSTLIYNTGNGFFPRGLEWSQTSGAGYPYNVQMSSGSSLDLGNGGAGTARQMAGSLIINSGGELSMAATPMTAALTILGGVSNAGTLTLSSLSGGDLHLQGSFSNTGTFVHNNRAVFFEGGATQIVTDASGTTTMPYVRINKSGGTVQLNNNMTTLGPNGSDSLQFTGATSTLTLNGKTLTLGSTVGTPAAGSGLVGDAGASLSLQNGGGSGAMGTILFVSGGQTLNNLNINRSGGSATVGTDLFLGSTLALTAGDIIMSGLNNTLTMPNTATTTGVGDVQGNVKRTGFAALTAQSFGNPNTQVSFQTGTLPSDVTVRLVKAAPSGPGFGFPGAVARTYTVTPNVGSGYTATLRLHYLDSELGSNVEANLNLWRFNGSTWNGFQKTGTSLEGVDTNEYVERAGVTQFSPWTLSDRSISLTKAKLVEFKATQYDMGTAMEWKTSYEVDNLGFNIYRDVAGRRTLVNATLIAGSALVAGPNVAMTAGNSYSWTDVAGGTNARYWLEEVDLAGKSTFYGPYVPARAAGRPGKGMRSPLISQLNEGAGDASARDAQHQWVESEAARTKLTTASGKVATKLALEKQRWLAAQPAVKLSVRASGWYRVTRDQLSAAGLNPAADPTRLQMYVGGVEVPIHVDTTRWARGGGAVEFYGEGLDVTSTDTQVYWLVEGDSNGLRTDAPRNAPVAGNGIRNAPGGIIPVGPPVVSPDYFNYTVERRDRTVYFSSLQNGDAENFFGSVVNANTSTQTLTVRNRYQTDAPATLEVALQGVTAGQHHVSVLLNGAQVGVLDLDGQENRSATFSVNSSVLREGDNQVRMVSGGSGDVSITDHLRLSYRHTFRADDDRLRFKAPAGVVQVGGFNSPYIRVVDVTNPSSPFEVPLDRDAVRDPQQGTWSVVVNVTGGATRELYAFANTQTALPSAVTANKPSTWSTDAGQQADMVVITHGDFTEQVAPLVAQRTAEGMNVKVVDVEDLYDEFSYGAHTPQAIREFLASTKAGWDKAPAYVLLVGDGTYDPRDRLGRGRFDLVPSKLVDAGAMETASDDWFADFDGDGISDIAVGRLPVRTQAEAATVINKIVGRTSDPTQTSALLVADREGADGFSFEAAADGLQTLLPTGSSVTRVNRGTQDAATVRSQILAGVNAGPLVVNWTGHGSIDVWTGDGLLRGTDAPSLTNGSRLPLFVMMTCLNGYYEGTGLDSLAESVLKAEQGGAYAVWASSGMTEPNAQAQANRELYRIIFSEGGAVRLGDAVRRAKAATTDRDVRTTWVFFGDPSSRLR